MEVGELERIWVMGTMKEKKKEEEKEKKRLVTIMEIWRGRNVVVAKLHVI